MSNQERTCHVLQLRRRERNAAQCGSYRSQKRRNLRQRKATTCLVVVKCMQTESKEATTHLIFIDSAGMKSHVAAEKNAIDSQNTRQAPSRRGFFECIRILFCARGWRRIRKWERIGRSKNLHRPKLGREEVMRTHQSLSADGFFQRTRILGVWTVFFLADAYESMDAGGE